MKTSKLKIGVAFLFLLALSFTAFARLSMESYSKKTSKSFSLNDNGTVHLVNKHGYLHITTWDKPTVDIEVEVKLEARSDEKGQKMLNAIEVDLNGGGDEVNGIVRLTGKGNFKQLEINMTVKMPKSAVLDASNKFGDFYINELDGQSTIKVAYGAMNIGSLNNEKNDLSIAYGSANISYAEFASINARYSEFKLKKCRWLILDSKFSEAEIGGIGRLDFTSAYDEIDVKGVGEMKGKSKFSEFDVDKITKIFDIKNAYGEIDLDFVSESFEKILISSSFADISIDVEQNTSFEVKANASFADISIPSGGTLNKSKSFNSSSYKAKYGNDQTGKTITVTTSYGDFRLNYTD